MELSDAVQQRLKLFSGGVALPDSIIGLASTGCDGLDRLCYIVAVLKN
jgi:hypothetical protein